MCPENDDTTRVERTLLSAAFDFDLPILMEPCRTIP